MYHPKRRTDLQERVVEGDAIILDVSGEEVHHLNKTATFIWERCTGDRSVESIYEELVDAFAVDADTAEADTEKVLREFRQKGLLEATD